MIWLRQTTDDKALPLDQYAAALAFYLARIDSGYVETEPPAAEAFGLPRQVDLYADPPPYVIEGYQNYKDFLHRHRALTTAFASGVVAFIPTDSTLEQLKENAPPQAFPNKEASHFQHELRKFAARRGTMHAINRLTREALDTLAEGEYFFAVGLSGTIRFGRELLREEVKRLEAESGL